MLWLLNRGRTKTLLKLIPILGRLESLQKRSFAGVRTILKTLTSFGLGNASAFGPRLPFQMNSFHSEVFFLNLHLSHVPATSKCKQLNCRFGALERRIESLHKMCNKVQQNPNGKYYLLNGRGLWKTRVEYHKSRKIKLKTCVLIRKRKIISP